jgi:hypothetical protein
MTGKVVLITQDSLHIRAGSVMYTRDLAAELVRQGHHPVVYCPDPGEVAADLRRATVTVVTSLDALTVRPDVIHGNHPCETAAAVCRFPEVPAVFVCHAWDFWQATPPRLSGVDLWVAVDETCRERLWLKDGIDPTRVRVAYNGVDVRRFLPRPALPARPRRALVFSNYAEETTYVPAIREACERHGVELDVLGAGVGRPVARPEDVLGGYDVVFGKARCALEAAAVGCAVVLADFNGLGGLVTRADVDELRRANFGWRCLSRPLHADAIAAELAGYDAEDARVVHEHVRATMDLATTVGQLVDLYDEAAKVHAERVADPAADLRWLGDWVTRMAAIACDHRREAADERGWAATSRADLTRRQAELDARIADAATHLAELEGILAGARSENAELEDRLAAARSENAVLEDRLAGVRSESAELEGLLAGVRSENAELEARVAALAAEQTALLATRTFRVRRGVLTAPVVGPVVRAAVATLRRPPAP